MRGELLRQIPGAYRTLGWTSDSRSLFVYPPADLPLKIQRFDVLTGALAPWKEITPTDLAGVLRRIVVLNPDGDAYAYTISKLMTNLFIVKGLQ